MRPEAGRERLDKWMETTRRYVLGRGALPDSGAAPAVAEEALLSHHGRDRLLSRVRQQLLRLVQETRRYDEYAMDRLERAFHSHISFMAAHPGIHRVMLTWALQEADGRLRRRVRKLAMHYAHRVLRLVVQGQQEGSIRSDIDPQTATRIYVAMLQNLVLRLPDEPAQTQAALRETSEVFAAYRLLVGHSSNPSPPLGAFKRPSDAPSPDQLRS